MTNTLKLKAKIIEHNLTQVNVAQILGISTASLNAKINNRSEFKASEIRILTASLKLTSDEMQQIFLN